jgi:hypothetical protein
VAASAPLPFGTATAPHQSQSAELLAGAGGLLQSGSRRLQSVVSGLPGTDKLLQSGSRQLQSAGSGLPSADELLQSGAQRLQSVVSGLPGAGELLQSGSQHLQSAFGGMQPPAEDTHQPLTKIAQVRRHLMQAALFTILQIVHSLLLSMPAARQPPFLCVSDLRCRLIVSSFPLQAAYKIAEALAPATHAVFGPLDVFGGAWLLDLMFWGILLTLSYSLIVLAPKQ